MTVRINKQKINLREKLAEFEGKVNSLEAYNTVLENLPYESSGLSVWWTNSWPDKNKRWSYK